VKRWLSLQGFLLAVILLVPLAAATADQTSVSSETARLNSRIETIDQSLGEATAQTKMFTRGADSGVLSFYDAGGRFSKLVVQLVSEKSGDVAEYYFSSGALIYAIEVCKNFSSTSHNGSIAECNNISEDRFYISDGQLVEWLGGKGPGPVTLQKVVADKQALAAKLDQVIQSAREWLAFAGSPMSDFEKFQSKLNGSR